LPKDDGQPAQGGGEGEGGQVEKPAYNSEKKQQQRRQANQRP